MSIEEIEKEILALKASRLNILTGGQEYKLNNRSTVRPDLVEINKQINKLELRLEIAKNGLQSSDIVFSL